MAVPASVKSAVYTTAHFSGLSRALALRYRGRGIIFALHSVVDDDAFHPVGLEHASVLLVWARRLHRSYSEVFFQIRYRR